MLTYLEHVNQYGKYWIDENGIFIFKYHPGAVIDLEAAKFLYEERRKLFNGKRYPLLLDGRGLKYISGPALQYIASDEFTNLYPAVAFLKDSFLSNIFGNILLKLIPNIPHKIFTNKEEAIIWLLKHK